MNFILMLAAFFIILGIAQALKNILKLNIGEGMFLAVGVVVLGLYVGGLAGSFAYGMYTLFAISAVGYLLTVYGTVRRRASELSFLQSPYLIIVFLFFLYCLIVYYNDFIQHIDEFHQWAYAVKYMLESDQLAHHSPLIGNVHPYGTGLFYLFFQKITGYNEQNMYVASSFLVWIGLMLPFSVCGKKAWKKVFLYCAVMYFGIFSLYTYGIKNLYVDLPVCAWAGGLAGWWINREKKKTNLLVWIVGIAMIWYFKWQAGPLFAILAVLFAVVHTLFIEKNCLLTKKRKHMGVGVLFALAILFGIAGICITRIPAARDAIFGILGNSFSSDRLKNTVSVFVTALAGRPLAPRSSLKIAFLPFLIGIAILMKAVSDLRQQREAYITYLLYEIGSAGIFMAGLLCAYVFLFDEREASEMASGVRYLSIYAIFIFIIALVWLFQDVEARNTKKQEYLALGLLLIFLTGLNEKFIPNATALNSAEVNGYTEIVSSKKQADQIQKEITAEDRVYFLDQKGNNEYAKTTALYYFGEQVSDYIIEPWKFTPDGNMTRLSEQKAPDITAFPQLMADGGYTYLWIYNTDKYLTQELPEVFECDDKIESGSLYEVVYENGEAVGLESVW